VIPTDPFDDNFREECGVFDIHGYEDPTSRRGGTLDGPEVEDQACSVNEGERNGPHRRSTGQPARDWRAGR